MGQALLCALAFASFAASTAALAQETRPLVKAQTLYLPIYSHMLYGNLGRSKNASSVLLSALVSIRNTDTKRPMRILSARYFDTHGKQLGERVPTPVVLPPLRDARIVCRTERCLGRFRGQFHHQVGCRAADQSAAGRVAACQHGWRQGRDLHDAVRACQRRLGGACLSVIKPIADRIHRPAGLRRGRHAVCRPFVRHHRLHGADRGQVFVV
jgi:hypothetical protein